MPKIGLFGLLYLFLIPFLVFSGQSPFLLFLSLSLGYLLFRLFQKPSLSQFLIFLAIVVLALIILRPRLGLDMGLLNAINSQRGEHPDFQNNIISRLVHNKSELSHSFISNFNKLLSPAAIFASGFWHRLDPYYPLGYLFPWDIYFLYRYFRSAHQSKYDRNLAFFVPALGFLLLLTGLIYVDQAIVFSFAVLFFLAFLSVVGFSTTSPKTQLGFLIANILYLLYQLNITAYFKL
ncbi:TPA: hypothetical protein DIU27_00785 [Candidatus Collierbacteria bacterium]|uniref:Uncharacterized protein n=1 Tax=Candidatus Collierbacteria bacterium GW2011_GWB2_44_22 TaxID=1618387 RepID=A0A0G1HZP3_9BACT|nr:MAG: hypothetical protein UW31_C0005G0012 [Candidatus Collierbacteria bacterium GW2011_GWA2_44_13]KKT49983.1 MAG: hypothetical protein UW42_C0027G0002 [Candidatus Collierbacteria bacterium GW2011_GWB1_44_197]KKT52460.1 MAG: hypothetical protein UW44_C0001G0012 [Candidatus Collierbacteria bacterium GW2011_GWB2_44_22]KKT61723.1 MAG: hypothetical protein UW56_C0020G0012 [Candidatus Collierbacteria bacterium GW2011_GWD1_44_27]KKT65530.1 MAG: hypothetical protein UW58_C0027G0012 [Candidatus Colli